MKDFSKFIDESYLDSNYAPLYHNTTTYAFTDIIIDNKLKKTEFENSYNGKKIKMVSLTRKKDLDLNYYKPFLDIVVELDTNLLSRKYKIIPYDFFIHSEKEFQAKSDILRKEPFEFEEIILNDIDNIMYYIISVNFLGTSILDREIAKILPLLKNNNKIIYNNGKLY